MKKILISICVLTLASCYTVKSSSVHNITKYNVKQHGMKMIVTVDYTRIVTIDTLKR